MTSSPVLAANCWPTNGNLIADVARLGYLNDTDIVLDPTYGKGIWWTRWKPDILISHCDDIDFRDAPYPDSIFDAAAFDPPYVSVGSRHNSGIKKMYNGYGLMDAPATPTGVQLQINDGLDEMSRVVKKKGVILVKCQDYISSGKYWMGTHYTLSHGLGLGLTLVDRFEMFGPIRPQPPGRRQVHARRNLSTLFVFRNDK